MNYPYKCASCDHRWEVIKSVTHIDDQELCPKCSDVGKRYIGKTSFYGASDWNKGEYNPGLGCFVRNSSHRKQICKERGLEEIGNENPQKIATEFAKDREKRKEERYERIIERGWDA